MTKSSDPAFFKRADAFIALANQQIDPASRGEVSASMMYGTARFGAWIAATGFETGAEMAAGKDEAIEYFVAEYRQMLTENVENYIKNFDKYTAPNDG